MTEPALARTVADAARLLDVSPAALRAVRDRDARFPAKGPKGWNVRAVGLLLAVRKLERILSDPATPTTDRELLAPVAEDAERRLIAGRNAVT